MVKKLNYLKTLDPIPSIAVMIMFGTNAMKMYFASTTLEIKFILKTILNLNQGVWNTLEKVSTRSASPCDHTCFA